MPLLLAADAAYPLLPWVMKPFPDNGKLNKGRAHDNYHQSRARMVVENGCGRVKGRWRCRVKQNEACLQQMNIMFSTCFILHTICENNRETFQVLTQ